MAQDEPVLIVGAGLVGSTLAQALKKRNIPYRIFERDSIDGKKDFGWAVTLHWGVPPLQRLIPESVYESTRIADANPVAAAANELATITHYDLRSGAVLFRPPGPTGRRRVRRKQFGQCLLSGIEVEYSKHMTGFAEVPAPWASSSSSIVATFADGSTAAGSLLVACDGANSSTRRLLLPSDHATAELPCRLMGATVVLDTAAAAPLRAIDPFYFQGGDAERDVLLFFSFLDSPANNSRPEGQRDTYAGQVMVGWPSADGDTEQYPAAPPPTDRERLDLIRRWAEDWAEPFRGLVGAIPDDAEVNVVKVGDWLPPGGPGGSPRWDNHGGTVTLAGDATHPMTMYRGEAFNHGLLDLEELVAKIEPLYQARKDGMHGREWEQARKRAIDEYEENMLRRAYSAVLLSRQAALDAHDQKNRLNGDSPLVANRSVDGPYLDFKPPN